MKHFSVSISRELSDMISDLAFDGNPTEDCNINELHELILEWVKKSLNLLQIIAINDVQKELNLYKIGMLCYHGVDLRFGVVQRDYVIMLEDRQDYAFGLYEFNRTIKLEDEEDMPF